MPCAMVMICAGDGGSRGGHLGDARAMQESEGFKGKPGKVRTRAIVFRSVLVKKKLARGWIGGGVRELAWHAVVR